MSPTAATEAPGLPSAEFRANHTSLPEIPEGVKTSKGGQATPDDSFVQHDTYFFDDGNFTFLVHCLLCFAHPDVLTSLQVDGMLYCVHRYFFSRDLIYFSTRLAKLGIRDHEALFTIISIGDVERKDFEAILSILYPA